MNNHFRKGSPYPRRQDLITCEAAKGRLSMERWLLQNHYKTSNVKNKRSAVRKTLDRGLAGLSQETWVHQLYDQMLTELYPQPIPINKSEFVRSQPRTMSAKEIVEAGVARGIKLTAGQVYNIRANAKAKQNSEKALGPGPHPGYQDGLAGKAPQSDDETYAKEWLRGARVRGKYSLPV